MDMNESAESEETNSYLDPSIPIHEPGHIYSPAPKLVRNLLLSGFSESDESIQEDDSVSVYLRIKPCRLGRDEKSSLEIIDSKTILCKAPSDSQVSIKSRFGKLAPIKYTFSRIYDSHTDQQQMFEKCIFPKVKNFLRFKGCLIFSYGTTNAGKTYTIQGTPTNPGIIPRLLYTLFEAIKGHAETDDRFRPYMVSQIEQMSEEQIYEEMAFKKNLLASAEKNQCQQSELMRGDAGKFTSMMSVASSKDSVYNYMRDTDFFIMEQHLREHSNISFDLTLNDTFTYSLWVSFAEIYNDGVYDLLEPLPISKKRTQLKMGRDAENNFYVKGLRYVRVSSAEEAYKVLIIGKKNLHISGTALNSSSSRSHCIFGIKLVAIENTNKPESAVCANFSICDLAGTERQKKTMNSGDRLKESQSINASLHTLSRCFQIRRDNLVKKEANRIPYRDSKLTQILQKSLEDGHNENIIMILNVNPCPDMYEETQQVLKTSALAFEVIAQPRAVVRNISRVSRFSQIVRRSSTAAGKFQWDSVLDENPLMELETIEDEDETEMNSSADSEEYDDFDILREENIKLREELDKALEKNSTLEDNLRQEMHTGFMKMLDDKRIYYKKQLEDQEKRLNAKIERRAEVVQAYYLDEIEKLEDKLAELSSENKNPCVKSENPTHAENVIKDLKDENKKLSSEAKMRVEELNSLKEEVQKLKEALEEKDVMYADLKKLADSKDSELQKQSEEIAFLDNKRNKYVSLLDTAAADYKALEEERDNLISNLRKLETEVIVKNEEIANYISSLDMKQNYVEELEEKMETLQETMSDQALERERHWCGVEKERDEAKSRYKELSELIATKEKQTLALKQQLKDALKKIESLRQENKVALKKMDEMRERSPLNESIKKFQEDEIQSLHAEIKDLTSRNDSLEKKINSDKEKINSLEALLASYKEKFKNVEDANVPFLKNKNYELEMLRKRDAITIQQLENELKDLRASASTFSAPNVRSGMKLRTRPGRQVKVVGQNPAVRSPWQNKNDVENVKNEVSDENTQNRNDFEDVQSEDENMQNNNGVENVGSDGNAENKSNVRNVKTRGKENKRFTRQCSKDEVKTPTNRTPLKVSNKNVCMSEPKSHRKKLFGLDADIVDSSSEGFFTLEVPERTKIASPRLQIKNTKKGKTNQTDKKFY